MPLKYIRYGVECKEELNIFQTLKKKDLVKTRGFTPELGAGDLAARVAFCLVGGPLGSVDLGAGVASGRAGSFHCLCGLGVWVLAWCLVYLTFLCDPFFSPR